MIIRRPYATSAIHRLCSICVDNGRRGKTLALVGSRRSSPTGQRWTETLAHTLSEHNLTIVSGLARGIDSAAHRGALKGPGSTIAVLGCGIDRIYPIENRHLFEQIAQNGIIVSEYPPGTRAKSRQFSRSQSHHQWSQ